MWLLCLGSKIISSWWIKCRFIKFCMLFEFKIKFLNLNLKLNKQARVRYFDLSTFQWIQLPSLSQPRNGNRSTVIMNKYLCTFGGTRGISHKLNRIDFLDLNFGKGSENYSWFSSPHSVLKCAKCCFAMANSGNNIFIAGLF